MSSVLKFVEQLVQETSPADDFPRLEMQEGGAIRGAPRLPVTAEQQELARRLHGKDFNELNNYQKVAIRSGKIKMDPVTFEEYLDDYKKMAADRDYKPKFVKTARGAGFSAQQIRARNEAKRTIEGFESKLKKKYDSKSKSKT